METVRDSTTANGHVINQNGEKEQDMLIFAKVMNNKSCKTWPQGEQRGRLGQRLSQGHWSQAAATSIGIGIWLLALACSKHF